jgi:hypothetical protein
MHNTKTYAVVNLTDIELVDFSQVGETSQDTIRKSVDETQFILKWQHEQIPTFITDGTITPVEQIPTFITDGTITPVGTYDHHAILELVATSAWSSEE